MNPAQTSKYNRENYTINISIYKRKILTIDTTTSDSIMGVSSEVRSLKTERVSGIEDGIIKYFKNSLLSKYSRFACLTSF